MGEEKGWEYLKALKPQVAQFTPSGFTPGQKAGAGEYLIAVNFISDQNLVSAKGQKLVSTIYDQAGWTVCPVGKIKNKANEDVAKAFIDFVYTRISPASLVRMIWSRRAPINRRTAIHSLLNNMSVKKLPPPMTVGVTFYLLLLLI